MGRKKKNTIDTDQSIDNSRRFPPARTPEERENQMIALAMDLVEERLRDKTATSQETVHFLRLATQKAKLEEKALEEDIRLKAAKSYAIEQSRHIEELYSNAIEAMKKYSGQGDQDEQDS